MNEYEKQAEDFLKKTETEIEIKESAIQSAPLWAKEGEEHGIKYDVKLSNKKGSYSFSFWDSIANNAKKQRAENYFDRIGSKIIAFSSFPDEELKNKMKLLIKEKKMTASQAFDEAIKPSAYSVLACLQKYEVGTIWDFMSEFGYEGNNETEKIYNAVKAEYEGLSRIFTETELEKMQEIS